MRHFLRRFFISFSVYFPIDLITFSGSKELLSYNLLKEIIHLLFIDGLKLHSRNEKGLNSLVQTIHVISEDRDGVRYRKVCYVSD